MIINGSLTAEQRRRSQRFLNYFNAANGFSYQCVGETVMVLFLTCLAMPDYVAGIIGGMLYFGYLMLPLGRTVTALVGGAKTQAYFWLARNTAGLLVASAVFWVALGWHVAAIVSILTGSFLFYGFRAAGCVMVQPLIGDITTEEERGKLIAVNGGLFYGSCFVAIIMLIVITGFRESAAVIAAVIAGGCLCGMLSASFVARVDETNALRDSAKSPIRAEIKALLRDSVFQRYLAACFAVGLAVIMLFSTAVLVVKKGLDGGSAGKVLQCSFWQFLAATFASFAVVRVSSRIGPRRTLIGAYCLAYATVAAWAFAPMPATYAAAAPLCGALFAAFGAFRVTAENSLCHYFLQTVPAERRIASTMLTNGIAGVSAGLIGMALSGFMLKHFNTVFETDIHPEMQFAVYRVYFKTTLLIFIPGLIVLLSVKPLPKERRWRSWIFGSHYR